MTTRRDRLVTSSGRHSARPSRGPRWGRWTAAVLVAGVGASVFVLRDEVAPAVRIDALVKPAEAATAGDGEPGIYPPAAPAVIDAQAPSAEGDSGGGASAATETPPPTPASRPTPTPALDVTAAAARASDVPLPARSGQGRRIVFSVGEQRVWLVRKGGQVARTYAVSGSVEDNLDPGTYEVYSRSRHAMSYDLGSTMEYFVRFTRGENAPIGFHTIPVDADGEPLQTLRQLGTPLSSGCVRQHQPDAIALWEFAPVGTTVVVVA